MWQLFDDVHFRFFRNGTVTKPVRMQHSITDWLVQAVGNTLDLINSASMFSFVDIFYFLDLSTWKHIMFDVKTMQY